MTFEEWWKLEYEGKLGGNETLFEAHLKLIAKHAWNASCDVYDKLAEAAGVCLK